MKGPKAFICIAMLLLSASFVFASSSAVAISSYQEVRLQLKWKHQFQFAGYYAAQEKGFYEQAGLKVSINEAQDGQYSTETVLAGEADFGIGMSDIIVAKSRGKPIVALAAIYQHSPLVFLAPSDRGIKSVQQLKNRKVMLEAHSAELLAFLHSEGVKPSSLALFPHTYGVKELINGEIDAISAYLTDEPFLLEQANIDYHIFYPQSSGIDFYGDVLFTTQNTINSNPTMVEKFVQASLKGWQYAMNNPEEMANLIYNNYSKRHSLEHLKFEAEKSKELVLQDFVDIGYMSRGRWTHIAQKYEELGLIDNDIDLSNFIYSDFIAPTDYWKRFVESIEIIIAIIALIFVIRLIKSQYHLENLDKKNKLANNKLKMSKKRYLTLLSNMPGMAFKCKLDSDYTMLYVSKGCFKLTGYNPSEIIKNKKISFKQLIDPQDYSTIQKVIKEAFDNEKSYEIKYKIKNKQNEVRWVWEQGKFIFKPATLIEGFITDITKEKMSEIEREKLIKQLQDASKEIKTLRGILPICSACKKIRDDKGSWNRIEAYIKANTDAEFSHGICPECYDKMYSDTESKK